MQEDDGDELNCPAPDALACDQGSTCVSGFFDIVSMGSDPRPCHLHLRPQPGCKRCACVREAHAAAGLLMSMEI